MLARIQRSRSQRNSVVYGTCLQADLVAGSKVRLLPMSLRVKLFTNIWPMKPLFDIIL